MPVASASTNQSIRVTAPRAQIRASSVNRAAHVAA